MLVWLYAIFESFESFFPSAFSPRVHFETIASRGTARCSGARWCWPRLSTLNLGWSFVFRLPLRGQEVGTGFGVRARVCCELLDLVFGTTRHAPFPVGRTSRSACVLYFFFNQTINSCHASSFRRIIAALSRRWMGRWRRWRRRRRGRRGRRGR